MAEIIMTLVIVSMGVALVAGLGQQVMDLANRSKQTAAVIELRSKTNAITRNIDSWLGKLRSSSNSGAIFSACIPDPSAASSIYDCPAVDSDLLSNDQELAKIAGTQLHASSVPLVDMMGDLIAGTTDAPVYYDLEGRLCTQNCAFKSTGFMLRSNSSDNSNPGDVRFIVKVESQRQKQGQTPIKTLYLSVDVGSEWQQTSGYCPQGFIKVGYLSNGQASCVNPTESCPAGKLQLGLNSNGTPICKSAPKDCGPGVSVAINAAGDDFVCSNNTPCKNGEIFMGFFAGTGAPICSGSELSCAEGEVQIGIKQNGSGLLAQCKSLPSCLESQKLSYDGSQFLCQNATVAHTCADDKIVVGINQDGSLKCEARNRDLASTELNCPSGKYVSGLHPDGKVICTDLPSSNNNQSSSSSSIGNNGGDGNNGSDGADGITITRGISSADYLMIEIANKGRTRWACANDINIKDLCADLDGCTIRFLLQHETYGDSVRIFEHEMYLEQSDLSNNNKRGIHGHIRGENTFTLGDGSKRTLASIWDSTYIHNYIDSVCPKRNGVDGPAYRDPYLISIKSHPKVKTRVIIKD